jgi:hypothetical protein
MSQTTSFSNGPSNTDTKLCAPSQQTTRTMTSTALVTGQETARIAKLQDQKVHASIGIGAGRMGRVGVKGQIPSPLTIGKTLYFGAHACFGHAGRRVWRAHTLVKYAVRHVPLQPRLPPFSRPCCWVGGWNPGSSHGLAWPRMVVG